MCALTPRCPDAPYCLAKAFHSIISNLECTHNTDHGFLERGAPSCTCYLSHSASSPSPRSETQQRTLQPEPFACPSAPAISSDLLAFFFFIPQGAALPALPEGCPWSPKTLRTLSLEDSPLGDTDLTHSLLCPRHTYNGAQHTVVLSRHTPNGARGTRRRSVGIHPTGPGTRWCSMNT